MFRIETIPFAGQCERIITTENSQFNFIAVINEDNFLFSILQITQLYDKLKIGLKTCTAQTKTKLNYKFA